MNDMNIIGFYDSVFFSKVETEINKNNGLILKRENNKVLISHDKFKNIIKDGGDLKNEI